MHHVDLHGEAATTVLLRDGRTGLEVLLLERVGRGSFAHAWVFPGGHIDPEDYDAAAPEVPDAAPRAGRGSATGERHDGGAAGQAGPGPAEQAALAAAARRAGAREAHEETGLEVDPDGLVPFSCWIPPVEAPKRLRTWFFIGPAPEGEVRTSAHEHEDHAWLTPAKALERHASGAALLFAPTWVTLHMLGSAGSVDEALAASRSHPPETFASHRFQDEAGIEWVLWQGDESYPAGGTPGRPPVPGARHRLRVSSLPWRYERTTGR